MMSLLAVCARHGRFLLVAGLVAGVALPDLAVVMRGTIAPLVVVLLFLAVLRLGPEGVRAGMRGIAGALRTTLLLQLALPLAALLVILAAGLSAHPLALAAMLVLSAPPITGSPNIALMIGGDAGIALRQLVLGTALMPLTVLPVLWLLPVFGSPAEVIGLVGRLLAIIACAGGLALALRHWRVLTGGPGLVAATDGLSAVVLGVVVIGLMSAVGPAFGGAAFRAALALAFAINLTMQIGVALLARRRGLAHAAALGIVAGNRNIALFLGVLPAPLVGDLLLFIGCYQIPMYLTPMLMGPVYRRLTNR